MWNLKQNNRMTIQEYVRVAVNGFPKEEFNYYREFFIKMDCEHCFYNGYACQSPKTIGVCIDYRVEKKDRELHKPNSKYEKKV